MLTCPALECHVTIADTPWSDSTAAAAFERSAPSPSDALGLPPDIFTKLRFEAPPTMLASLILLLLLPLASAQTFGWGPCKTPEVQANFTLEEFVGSWYLIEKLPAFLALGKCIQSNLTLMENDTVHVTNSHFFFGREWHFDGVLVTPHRDEPAKLAAHFAKFMPFMPDWVLATDYSTYSVVYSCMDFFHAFHLEYAWIFSRSTSLSPENLQHCREVLDHEGINTSRLQEVDQDCMDLPN